METVLKMAALLLAEVGEQLDLGAAVSRVGLQLGFDPGQVAG